MALSGFPLLLTVPAAAQRLEVELRDESTRAPVVGAIVRLLRGAVTVAEALSNEQGRVVLRVPAGTYRLQAARIGHTAHVADSVTLGPGETLRKELIMLWSPVELPAIEVTGTTTCRAAGGADAGVLWEEVRKTLTANVITQRERRVSLRVLEFERELSRAGRPLREHTAISRVTTGQPFRSLPVELLVSQGFVTRLEEDLLFAAPDAALLLSDAFTATHCFRAVRGRDGLVGLAFEPVPDRRVPDVEGRLWLDPATGALRFLEYLYTGLESPYQEAGPGGRLEFRLLPTGSWIVSYWHIRMPRFQPRVRREAGLTRSVLELVGYLERGGRAEPSP